MRGIKSTRKIVKNLRNNCIENQGKTLGEKIRELQIVHSALIMRNSQVMLDLLRQGSSVHAQLSKSRSIITKDQKNSVS